MVRSMTGFGRGEFTGPVGRLTVEIRGVNHRLLEIKVRLPRQISALEDGVRKMVQARIARGQLDMFIGWNPSGEGAKAVKVDKDLALAYYNALKEISAAIGSNVEITCESLARLPDVLNVEEAEVPPEVVWPSLQEAVGAGLDQFIAMREREGEALARDLLSRLDRIAQNIASFRERSPLVVEDFRQQLQKRLEELLGQQVDAARLAQEVVVFAVKADITEELVRLDSHLANFRADLTGSPADGEARAVGRKLEFLVQEINREVNTIASKANDVLITGGVVEVKTELEKIREQIQNLE